MADFFFRSIILWVRQVDPYERPKGKLEKQSERKLEAYPEVVNRVVSLLAPTWGPCALLIYNALRGKLSANCLRSGTNREIDTNYRGYCFGRHTQDLVAFADFIAKDLRNTVLQINIPKDTEILNPAAFISRVMKTE